MDRDDSAPAARSLKLVLWRPVMRTLSDPAAWFFAAVWFIALGILVLRGYADRALGAPFVLLPTLFLSWLTVLLTEDPPDDPPHESRPRLVVQLLVVLAISALLALSAMFLFQVGPRALGSIPLWSGIFDWLLRLGQALPFPAPVAISNPVLEVGLPLVLLLALGASWRELGFSRSHRAGRVIALWSVIQLLNLVVLVITGKAWLLRLLGVFIRNAFQNGPVEEFLFRGALMTRLSLLVGGGWGLVLSALTFGLWHVGANAHSETGGDLPSAVCAGILGQAPYGIAFGVIFRRTRSLLAGSIVHMAIDLP
jgi:membrane protease YdiL (CAAX protease family)